MSHFRQVHIQNFKSIQNLEFTASRVNLLIGKPNVGKSNILEALGLFSLPYLSLNNRKTKKISDFIRCNAFTELFPFRNIENSIKIETDVLGVSFAHNVQKANFELIIYDKRTDLNPPEHTFFKAVVEDKTKTIFADFNVTDLPEDWPKFYRFTGLTGKDRNVNFLIPPFGHNAAALLNERTDIATFVGEYLNEYGLDLVLDKQANSIKIQRRSRGYVEQLPVSILADTLQRIIFTLLAIKTNINSAIILEEPESHMYPKYITSVAREIVENKTNQFFIATHSPYLLTEMMETLPPGELGVFVAYYKDYQTQLRKLSANEISENLSYGIDAFLTLDKYYTEYAL